MIIAQATDAQVLRMARLAILASIPVGLGMLHFNPALKESDIVVELEGQEGREQLHVDYYQGRMTKFNAWKYAGGGWQFRDTVDIEYQSWIKTYPDYQALYDASVQA